MTMMYCVDGMQVKFNHLSVFCCTKYSINKAAASFGQQLLDIRYVDEKNGAKTWISRHQRIMLAVLTVGGTWINSRIDDLAMATKSVSYFKRVSCLYSCMILFNETIIF
jgi:Pex2 / Pex12 amino terminal region